MFRSFILLGSLLGFLWGCRQEPSMILVNELDLTRGNEPVVVSRTDFEKLFGPGEPGQVPVLKSDERLIPCQLDDLNGDGKWDELAFVVTIDARANLKIRGMWVPEETAPEFEKRTQVYLGAQNADGSFTEVTEALAPVGLQGFPNRYQSEGVGWENDKMAFRIYFDCRNTKDLFGKLTPGLILHRAGTAELGSYHELAPWGMDILHCGSSLGAGGIALIEGDSLFRLGSTAFYQYKEITEGPARAIFELKYRGWEITGKQYEAIERITLWTGKHWFRSEVTIREFPDEKQVATGIVTSRLDTLPVQFQANADFTAILTHGKQSLNNDILAMAVLAPSEEVSRIGRTSNTDFYKMGYQTVPEKSFSNIISETYYLGQKISSGKPSVHYFFAMWGLENPKWNNVDSVQAYIRLEADKFSSPIVAGPGNNQ
jgi:hypothetical protein